MKILTTLRIARLKRKARAAYSRMAVPDHLDCGRSLADEITGGRLSRAEREFNEIMAELRRIDPNAPAQST